MDLLTCKKSLQVQSTHRRIIMNTDFLKPIIDVIKPQLKSLAITAIVWFIGKSKDEELFTLAERGGLWLSKNARQAIGGDWEKIEEKLQAKIPVLIGGLQSGFDKDDGA
jgi:hypothetical protein